MLRLVPQDFSTKPSNAGNGSWDRRLDGLPTRRAECRPNIGDIRCQCIVIICDYYGVQYQLMLRVSNSNSKNKHDNDVF